MMNKTIDIVIPVWNGGRYIENFIEKMLLQTYQNYKLFFVYDKSEDNTLEILTKYHGLYESKIQILYNNKKCGAGAARDYAMDSGLIQGDYVIFLDADDYPEPEFLEEMLKEGEKNHADLVMCGFDCFDDVTGNIINIQMVNNKRDFITDIKGYTDIAYINPAVWNKLYRREIVEKVRFGNAKSMEDGLYIAKILPYVHSIKIINKVLYHYRVSNYSAQARISTKEFQERWNYYVELADYYMDNGDIYAEYIKIFELITFVKCAVGLTYRISFMDMRHMHKYTSYTKKMMDRIIPGWRKNENLRLSGFFTRNMKANAITICALLYKMNCFDAFICFYWLYIHLFHKEVRW